MRFSLVISQRLMLSSALIFNAIFLISCSSTSTHLSSEGINELNSFLQQTVETTHIPGMVALVTTKDDVIYERAFGQMDVANNKAMTTDAIFRLASMTKPVTSVAVMMLVEQGKIDLDDPIEDYLPELANREVFTSYNLENGNYTSTPAQNKITIRHLLTHTSGLGYSFDSPILANALGNDFSASATSLPLLHEPGEEWTYGESTRVLGHLVETVSGMDLFSFMQQRIFQPLQMNDISYDIPASKNSRVVTVHNSNGQQLIEAPNPGGIISSPANGDGGLSSTARDYAKFIQFYLNKGSLDNSGQLLSPETIALMGQNHTGEVKVRLMPSTNDFVSKPFPLGAGVDSYGLGFQVTGAQIPDMRSPGSLAWAGIYNTEFWIDPAKGIGAILLIQVLPFYDEASIEALQGFEQRIYQNLE